MNSIRKFSTIAIALVCLLGSAFIQVASAAESITRTPWQQHNGFETPPVYFTSCGGGASPSHGDICEFVDAEIPPATDSDWGPAPDPDIINFSVPSILPSSACRIGGDFTYFQTFVNVPAGFTVDTFTIQFSGMDDGSVVSICNAGCSFVPGSHVNLGNTGTSDLSSLVVGGNNRIVITQVDDCATGNNLRSAIVVLNGEPIVVPPPPPTDSDGDGVSDDNDLCPDTAAGANVDANGCSGAQLDNDGDGVNDDDDLCPDTAAGASVDANGCSGAQLDSDGDGVDDDTDLCPATPAGSFVNAFGCSGAQAVSLVCPTTDEYKNHGQYVSCVAHAVNDARKSGLLTAEQGDGLVSAAAQSDVGKKAKPEKAGKK